MRLNKRSEGYINYVKGVKEKKEMYYSTSY